MTSLDTAIIKTLAYADLFNQSLTTDELHKYLIEYKLDDPQKLIDQSISKVSYSNNLWSLQANQKTVNLKKGQLKTTEYKIQHAKKYTKIFLLLPWIKFVGITGSIAGGTPTKTDDIDLLIITDQNRLWLTRLFLTIMLNMLGKRRKPNAKQSQINDKFCLNMWLAMDNLQEKHQDIYTANEIARIIPLLNRQDSFAHYLLSNNWTAKYLPNFQIQTANQNLHQIPKPKSFFINTLDHVAKSIQKKIMRQPTRETVENARLAFHPHDYRTEILQKYQQKLSQLGIKN